MLERGLSDKTRGPGQPAYALVAGGLAGFWAAVRLSSRILPGLAGLQISSDRPVRLRTLCERQKLSPGTLIQPARDTRDASVYSAASRYRPRMGLSQRPIEGSPQ